MTLLDWKNDSVLILDNSDRLNVIIELSISTFLWLTLFSWEQYEFSNILFESKNILLKRLIRLIGSSGINIDSN